VVSFRSQGVEHNEQLCIEKSCGYEDRECVSLRIWGLVGVYCATFVEPKFSQGLCLGGNNDGDFLPGCRDLNLLQFGFVSFDLSFYVGVFSLGGVPFGFPVIFIFQ